VFTNLYRHRESIGRLGGHNWEVEVTPMQIRSLAHLALPLAITLTAASFGCGGSAAEQATSATSAATRAPVAQSTHGPLKLVGDALGDVPMTAPQRAQIEQLATEAEARHAAARATRRDLTLAVAAQLEAGNIDRAALRPKIDAVAAAVAASQPADRAAFERLHALLGPDQRTAFVDALEARMHERMGETRGKGGMLHWAQELKLSDDQRAQIKAALEQHFHAGAGERGGGKAWTDRAERGAKLLAAFKQDRFVIDEVAPAQEVGQQAARSSDWFLGMAEAALPILTPEQRAIAAQKLRARAEQAEAAGPMMP
jgi:Spy/CpxP family protein refolding chaperone